MKSYAVRAPKGFMAGQDRPAQRGLGTKVTKSKLDRTLAASMLA